eukprot:8749684-Alexandrium_andersonii.AAC.1
MVALQALDALHERTGGVVDPGQRPLADHRASHLLAAVAQQVDRALVQLRARRKEPGREGRRWPKTADPLLAADECGDGRTQLVGVAPRPAQDLALHVPWRGRDN